MARPDVLIVKTTGGLGRQKPTDDGVSGLITQGVAVTSGLQLNTTYTLGSLKDLENLLVDAAYDTTNQSKLYFHVKEFYRVNPGAKLFLYVVARTVSMTQMADRTLTHAKKMLTDALGEIKQLAIALNQNSSYTPTNSGGLDGDVITAIPKAQALADEEFLQHRPVVVILAGHGMNGAVSALTNLRTLLSPLVAVVVAADHLLAPGTPAIGTALGMLSRANVNESIGWVEKFQLAGDGSFLNAGITNGSAYSALTDGDVTLLHEKGYIFALKHVGEDGFFFNGDASCAALDTDFAYVADSRVINKAARIVRRALIKQVNGPVPLQANGNLSIPFCGELEGKAFTALQSNMITSGEISNADVLVDPEQDVIAQGQLVVKFSIQPTPNSPYIVANIGFVKSI